MDARLSNPKYIADMGEKIYADKYKAEYEQRYLGQFVAIDVATGSAYRGTSPEAAYQAAQQGSPRGIFHLIRVGEAGAFRVSYASSNAIVDWIFR
jgi:hypothetical protein